MVREIGATRVIYTEASRETGRADRQGEIVAVDALWKSRELFLETGDLDLSHYAHLPNPVTGRPDLEYRIGVPTGVRREGKSIFVKGELFNPQIEPIKDSGGERADLFWFSIYSQRPAARWYPSVYGNIKGLELVKVGGELCRRLSDLEWTSIGFHNRVQNPDVPAVSLEALGPFAKADQGTVETTVVQAGGLHMDWGTFAKAMTVGAPITGAGAMSVGAPVTDTAARTGVQALMKEDLDGVRRGTVAGKRKTYLQAKKTVLQRLRDRSIDPTVAAVAKAYEGLGFTRSEARRAASQLLTEAKQTLANRR